MPYLGQQRVLLPGVQSSDLTTGKVKSGRGKDALAQGAYDSIASVIVPTGGLSAVAFAGIPQGYRHLEISISGCTVRGTYGYDGFYFILNDDSGTNYTTAAVNGNGAGGVPGAGGGANDGSGYMDFAMGTTVSSYPGIAVLSFLDYAVNTKYKSFNGLGGTDLNGTIASTPGRVNYISGTWFNTDAINKITFTPVNNNFAAGTIFSLYGVK